MKTTTAARRLAVPGVLLTLAAACGVGSESGNDATSTTTGASDASPAATTSGAGTGEAEDIEAVIEASRDEGPLVIYGNPSSDQWAPVLEAFGESYPWIEVETFDLGGTEAFQRYLSEESSGSATADMIVNTEGAGWLDLVERGQVLDYVDPELDSLPAERAVLAPGVFAWSYDPLVALFNRLALPEDEQPTSLAELAGMAEELSGQIGTPAVENGAAGLGIHGYLDAHGEEGWAVLEQLGPHTRAEDGTGALLGKLQSGEYVASFLAGGATRALIDTTETGEILNYRYFDDATPLTARGIGVTTAGDSPNSAKVLVNFLLSEEGQTVSCAGGFTPYRDGVDCPQGIPAIVEAIGDENLIFAVYPPTLVAEQAEIRERWNAAFGR
jgi:iron(III) transport system substrate-binding protein